MLTVETIGRIRREHFITTISFTGSEGTQVRNSSPGRIRRWLAYVTFRR
jgi:hypothetical protein